MGCGDGEKAETAGALEVAVDADGSCTEEDEYERADEFGDELLREVVQGYASGKDVSGGIVMEEGRRC
jgi:hypothetical protein